MKTQIMYERISIDISNELDWIIEKLYQNMKIFRNGFPSACTTEGKYRIKANDDWSNGFWSGMLWMAYEYSGDRLFKNMAQRNCHSFRQRVDNDFVMDHHDLGFLYTPSLIASYKLTGNELDRSYAIRAADKLLTRFRDKGQFLQACGNESDPAENRLIINSLLNLPLLYWASETTGNSLYKDIANLHYQTVIANILREDDSTHHTFYFDLKTGEPLLGISAQGFNNRSCCARGQAWIILGSMVNNIYQEANDKYFKNDHLFKKCYQYYKMNLPDDHIPYWDLVFDEQSNQYHDASAAVIVLCALLERKEQLKLNDLNDDIIQITSSLIKNYTTRINTPHQGILDKTVYSYADYKGINESNLWGDYFYMEALMRLHNPEFRGYW